MLNAGCRLFSSPSRFPQAARADCRAMIATRTLRACLQFTTQPFCHTVAGLCASPAATSASASTTRRAAPPAKRPAPSDAAERAQEACRLTAFDGRKSLIRSFPSKVGVRASATRTGGPRVRERLGAGVGEPAAGETRIAVSRLRGSHWSRRAHFSRRRGWHRSAAPAR